MQSKGFQCFHIFRLGLLKASNGAGTGNGPENGVGGISSDLYGLRTEHPMEPSLDGDVEARDPDKTALLMLLKVKQ